MPYKNIQWVKLRLELFRDYRFIEQCSDEQKLLYMALLGLAGAMDNKVPFDAIFIKRAVNLKMSEEVITNNINHLLVVFKKLRLADGNLLKFVNFSKFHNYIGKSHDTPEESEVKEKRFINTKDLLYYFRQKFRDHCGAEYIMSYARDMAILRSIISIITIEEAKTLIDKFFDSTDEFVKNSGFTIPVFKSQVNKLRTQQTHVDRRWELDSWPNTKNILGVDNGEL